MIGAAKSVVLDRELEEDKSHHSSGSRIRCPLCGWSPPQGRQMVLHLRL